MTSKIVRAAMPAAFIILVACTFAHHAQRSAGQPAARKRAQLTVTDDLGRRMTFTLPIRRVVSFSPGATEIAFAVGAGTKLVGDTTYCDYPPAARDLPHVGGLIDQDIEKVIALRPDVIITADELVDRSAATQIERKYGVPVYVMAADTYTGVERDVVSLGSFIGDVAATRETTQRMDAARDRVRQAITGLPIKSAFMVIWPKPLMTAGKDTFIADLIALAGGDNVANTKANFDQYPTERLVRDDPDVLLTTASCDHVMPTRLPDLSGLDLKAIKLRHIYAVPEDWLIKPGPRLALGLQALARVLHPDAFSGQEASGN